MSSSGPGEEMIVGLCAVVGGVTGPPLSVSEREVRYEQTVEDDAPIGGGVGGIGNTLGLTLPLCERIAAGGGTWTSTFWSSSVGRWGMSGWASG